jgi:hypothetical protein
VEFVVDKVTLEHVFSGYSDFPCQFAFHRLLHNHHHHHHPGLVQWSQYQVDSVSPHEKNKSGAVPLSQPARYFDTYFLHKTGESVNISAFNNTLLTGQVHEMESVL